MKLFSALFIFAASICPAAAGVGPRDPLSIIDLAAADGKYGTLLSAVTNTPGVLEAITDSFPVTIFGPTDSAFNAIAEIVAGLSETELAGVLAGHVVQGVFTAQMVIDAGCVELMTLAGSPVRVMATDGGVMVNDSTVIQPDIIGAGGVIHGIDTVILPGSFTPCPSTEMPSSKSSKKYGGKGKGGKGSKKYSSGKGGKGSKKSSKKYSGKGKGGKGSKKMSGPTPVVAPTTVSPPVTVPVAPVTVPVAIPVTPVAPAPVSIPVAIPVTPVAPAPVSPPVAPPVSPPTAAQPVVAPIGPPV